MNARITRGTLWNGNDGSSWQQIIAITGVPSDLDGDMETLGLKRIGPIWAGEATDQVREYLDMFGIGV